MRSSTALRKTLLRKRLSRRIRLVLWLTLWAVLANVAYVLANVLDRISRASWYAMHRQYVARHETI